MEHFRRIGVLHARAAHARGATLLDVREDHEWATGHAPDAVHIPLRELPARLRELPAHTDVLVICRSGHRSAEAAAVQARSGRPGGDVANVEGGMVAWAEAGFPVMAGAGTTGRVA